MGLPPLCQNHKFSSLFSQDFMCYDNLIKCVIAMPISHARSYSDIPLWDVSKFLYFHVALHLQIMSIHFTLCWITIYADALFNPSNVASLSKKHLRKRPNFTTLKYHWKSLCWLKLIYVCYNWDGNLIFFHMTSNSLISM